MSTNIIGRKLDDFNFARVAHDKLTGEELIPLVLQGNNLVTKLEEVTRRTIFEHLSTTNHELLHSETLQLIAQLSTTPFGRELLQLADALALAQLLNLGSIATHAVEDFYSTKVAIPWRSLDLKGATPADLKAQPAGDYATLVNGIIPSNQLPTTLSTDYTANSESAMLALPADPGDTCIRTDFNPVELFVLLPSFGSEPTKNWRRITDQIGVTQLNGQTGVVTLAAKDVGGFNC